MNPVKDNTGQLRYEEAMNFPTFAALPIKLINWKHLDNVEVMVSKGKGQYQLQLFSFWKLFSSIIKLRRTW